jgi:segregation and condensation protein B
MSSELSSRLEAFLFAEGGPVTRKKLLQFLECKPEQLASALQELNEALTDRGIALLQTETEVALAVSPSTQSALEEAFQKELGREIGDAGLEVVAILLYRGASTRAQIDYVRGVNSSTTLRGLLARGLVERTGNPEDAREYLYRPTTELMAYLGVRSAQDLPSYATIRDELAAFEKTQQASDEPFGHESGTSASDNA